MKKFLPMVIIVGAIITYLILTRGPEHNSGNSAPAFDAELIDGSAFSLSDLKGQYVLLDFWGSWCPPCRRDNPNLVALYNKFHGKQFQDASGFEVVTIALEKDNRRWQRAADKDGFTWKYQIVRIAKLVLTDALALKYNVSDVPSKFLISPQGDIISVNQSKQEIESFLSSKLNNKKAH